MKSKINLIINTSTVIIYLLFIVFSVKLIAGKLANKPQTTDDTPTIKVALLLDTSGSMDGLLSQAKSQLWSIVNKLSDAKINNKKPMLEIALYEYGNDGLSAENGHIRRILSFSSDLDHLSEKLFALSTNGGNEYCGQVIQKSIKELNWGNNDNNLRLIFIAGNERFNQGKVSYVSAANLAKTKNIVINPIFCGSFEEGINTFWREAAQITHGEYMSIEQDKKTVYIDSPYDKDILKLNKDLNKTYIPYGNEGHSYQERQIKQDKNASSFGSVNIVKRAVCKSKKSIYNNANWDLVDAAKDIAFELNDVKTTSLPAEIQSLSKLELKKYIAEKQKNREEIQNKINDLNKKRTLYCEKQKKADTNISNLENVMLNSIEKMAKKQGYKF